MYPKSFPSNIQSPVKKVKYICAGNQRPTLPAPPFLRTAPPVSLTSWALRITSWRHAFTLCRNKLWKFKKFCDNLRRTKGGRELDRGRVTSEHRCIGGRLAAKPAPFTLNCVEDFDSLNFAGQANGVEAEQMMLLQQQNCSKYSIRSLTLRNIH